MKNLLIKYWQLIYVGQRTHGFGRSPVLELLVRQLPSVGDPSTFPSFFYLSAGATKIPLWSARLPLALCLSLLFLVEAPLIVLLLLSDSLLSHPPHISLFHCRACAGF